MVRVEGVAVLKLLGCLTVGLIAGLVMRGWLAPAAGPTKDTALGGAASRDYAVLSGRIADLEESHAVFAAEYAELARQAVALQAQLRALTDELDAEGSQRSSNMVDTSTADASGARNEGSVVAALDDNGSRADQTVPDNLSAVEATPGQVFIYEVTGTTRGTVWGTNTYTDDSSLAAAAVHAGLLSPGETGKIMVTVLPGRDSYTGSAQNGVTSSDYAGWQRSYALQRIY
jgi:hypothetical protein